MTTPSPPKAAHSNTLLSAYRRLEPHDQRLLRVLAVQYASMTPVALQHTLSRLGIHAPGKRTAHNVSSLKKILRPLTTKKLLVQEAGRVRLADSLVDILTIHALKHQEFEAIGDAVRREEFPDRGWNYIEYHSLRLALRDLRIAALIGDHGLFALGEGGVKARLAREADPKAPVQVAFGEPFNPDLIDLMSPSYRLRITTELLLFDLRDLHPAGVLEHYAQSLVTQNNDTCQAVNEALFIRDLLQGDLEAAGARQRASRDRHVGMAQEACLSLFKGELPAAIAAFRLGLGLTGRTKGEAPPSLLPFYSLLYLLALICSDDDKAMKDAFTYVQKIKRIKSPWNQIGILALGKILETVRETTHIREAPSASTLEACHNDTIDGFEMLIMALGDVWFLPDRPSPLMGPMARYHTRAQQSGFRWLEAQLAAILARWDEWGAPLSTRARGLAKSGGFVFLVDLRKPLFVWQQALQALQALNPTSDSAQAGPQKQLIWTIWQVPNWVSIEPREQKRTKKGAWTKGRRVNLHRLKESPEEFDFLDVHDLRMVQAIQPAIDRWGYRAATDLRLDPVLGWKKLIGHPRVYLEDDRTHPLEVIESVPALQVHRKKAHITLTLEPFPQPRHLEVCLEADHRIRVVTATDAQRKMAEILGPEGLKVPTSAQKQVLGALAAIAPLTTVQSDIGGSPGLKEVGGDPRIHALLSPYGEGLKLELRVQPAGKDGAYFEPGTGGAQLIAEQAGTAVQITRDLTDERRRADAVLERCTTLARGELVADTWFVSTLEDALELLLELQSLGDQIRVDWPRGKPLEVTANLGASAVSMRVRAQQDWFAVTGTVTVDEQTTVDLQTLLGLLDSSQGRFIPLEDGRFLALTQSFRKRLEELRAYGQGGGRKGGLKLHPLASMAIEGFTEEVGSFQTDKAWKAHLKRLKDAQGLEPTVPSTLRAELRPYQEEGYRWLSRLACWGVGACLADDMGLGKTVQALAVLLERAPAGPALVVAPTSVVGNWEDEARRFAPTLNPILLASADRAGRARVLADPQPFDLIIASYGLLVHQTEALTAVSWHTVVLDEAQAIKNAATQRSKAAQALQGDFRLITTGTPVENHLGELWNLFRFLNPGLLGSLQRFNTSFAIPIERERDTGARSRLKRLIRPFILRRIKSQVLEELPERTEILLRLEMGPEELALYEATRRNAVETLEKSGEEPRGHQAMRILAEIMKLRRACCHPQLVLPGSTASSAKLEALGEILDDLRENRHKALIFSQFVDHLSLIRKHLEAREISYQYLDGSTPMPERRKRVAAFQAGEGDVFLISLRAGGLGLNLTAADYVVHMDPWWNPAVEDQASDRAHRIGQQRPVTVYRLITKGTIEEKIVALHSQKRNLADSLLEGTETAARLTPEELLALLREGIDT